MLRGSPLLAPLAVLVALSACRTILYDHPTTQQTDTWSVTIIRLQDGPHTVGRVGALSPYMLRNRSRLLHLLMLVRNDGRNERLFGYQSCDLDAGREVIGPVMVTSGPSSEVTDPDLSERYRAGQALKRRLVFAYPDGVTPTRIKCGLAVFPVPPP